jgi:uncharacterized protein
MAKNIIIIISVSLTLLVVIYFLFFKYTPYNELTLKIKNQDYKTEIASTFQQKAKGLSNRKELCPNCAMLFVFNRDKNLPIWMKNTLIPLDLIWINSQNEVVDIQTAQPQPNTPTTKLKIYQNQQPAAYVLEINANQAEKIDLKIGDTLKNFNIK